MVTHKLYRYRSLETSRDYENAVNAICENKLYFPSPLNFNDSFDSRPVVKYKGSDEQWKNWFKKSNLETFPEIPENKAEEMAEQIIQLKLPQKIENISFGTVAKLILKKIGICSFSKEKNDILMWSHYSNGHKGYCLEFDPNLDLDFFESVRKVTYQDEYPYINLLSDGNEEIVNALLVKSSHWCYEQEYRIINSVEGPKYYTFSPHALTGIILGKNMPDESKRIILSLNSSREFPVKILYAKLKENEFGIEV